MHTPIPVTVSAGILILNEQQELFLAHSTGNPFWDIPKGMLEPEESPSMGAIRECQEETGLVFSEEDLTELGLFDYHSKKKLHLFAVQVRKESLDLSTCICQSTFSRTLKSGKVVTLPEVDRFAWFALDSLAHNCSKNMARTLYERVDIVTLVESLLTKAS